MLYQDIDTTSGQSGSPIYLKRGSKWKIIGVHVGFDQSVKANIGTVITQKWFNHFILQIIQYLEKENKTSDNNE